MKVLSTVLLLALISFFNAEGQQKAPSLVVLGNVQDGGSPHIGCIKACCKELFKNPDKTRMVASLGLIDPEYKLNWLFDPTPDFPAQTNGPNGRKVSLRK
jgi:pyrroloquinoline quinone biosynthesis protein B